MATKIKVLIVDDSAAMRQLLTSILQSDPDIEVVGTAQDPFYARDKIKSLCPDVITLDVEMPRMDGITFLQKLMQAHPLPVVMVSSLTQAGCDVTLRALELGAVDFFPKPTVDTLHGVEGGAKEIINKVKSAARARIAAARPRPAGPITLVSGSLGLRFTERIIAIGASTGGTEAIREVLTRMPPASPGIVVVQHMPPGFTASFAERMDKLCSIRVKEAEDGDRVLPGHALIAPGNFQMELRRAGALYSVCIHQGERVNLHRPSVDVLFNSCADHAGRNAVAAILTGMGDDGARGLRKMRDSGARTIAQNEETCIVFGMPREAIHHGGAEAVLPIYDIADNLLRMAGE